MEVNPIQKIWSAQNNQIRISVCTWILSRGLNFRALIDHHTVMISVIQRASGFLCCKYYHLKVNVMKKFSWRQNTQIYSSVSDWILGCRLNFLLLIEYHMLLLTFHDRVTYVIDCNRCDMKVDRKWKFGPSLLTKHSARIFFLRSSSIL